jgi:hypothetical protein
MSEFSIRVIDPIDPTVRVVEITINNAANAFRGGDLPAGCHDDLAQIDRTPLGFTLAGTESDLIASNEIQATTCSTAILAPGWRSFTSGSGAAFDTLFLSTTDGNAARIAESLPVDVIRRDNSTIAVEVSGLAGGAVIIGEGFYPSWKASADGADLGIPTELDTQAAWFAPSTAKTTIVARFGPDRIYGVTMKIFMLGLLVVAVLIAVDPRTRRSIPRFRHARRADYWFLLPDLAASAFAIAIAGLPGLVLAVAALIMLRKKILRPALLGWLAVGCLVAAALASIPPFGPALLPLAPSWVANRQFSHQVALISALLLGVSLAQASSQRAGRNDGDRSDQDEPDKGLK